MKLYKKVVTFMVLEGAGDPHFRDDVVYKGDPVVEGTPEYDEEKALVEKIKAKGNWKYATEKVEYVPVEEA